MRLTIAILLLALNVNGATWFVTPSGAGSKNGTSYGNAWSNLASVVWGGAGVVANDTLYISGTNIWTQISGNFIQGKLDLVNSITIRGDYATENGFVFNGIKWQQPGYDAWLGPDVNGVYWNRSITNGANNYELAFQIDGIVIQRFDYKTNTTWTGGLGSSAHIGGTNFVKTFDGTSPSGHAFGIGNFGWYFNIVGKTGISFIGLKTQGPVFQNESHFGASNILFFNCTISDEGLPKLITKNDNWTFATNNISYATDGGIYVYDVSVSGVTGPYNLMVEGNTIHHCNANRYIGGDGHGIGVRNWANNFTVRNNEIYLTSSAIEFFGETQRNVTISGNYIHDTMRSSLTDAGGIMMTGGGVKSNFVIFNNLIANLFTNSTQPYEGVGISGQGDNPVYIYNNTVVNANVGIANNRDAAVVGQTVNNIVMNSRTYAMQVVAASIGAYTSDYNLFYPNANSSDGFNISPSFTRETHSVFANPLLVSSSPASIGDFAIQTQSPATGAGISISGYTVDVIGNAVRNPPSIGAFSGSVTILNASVIRVGQ